MSKLFSILTVITFFTFAGCSSKTPAAAASNAPEEKVVSTYLIGAHMDTKAAKTALEGAGFEVISEFEAFKQGTTLVFTNEILKKNAAKEGRGYAAVMRLLVDDEHNQISITNPIYFGKAFLQDDYVHTDAVAVLDALNGAFPGLKNSDDSWEFDGLADYHFMMGMPYYQDSTILAEGTQADLVAQAESYKKGKLVAFKLQLSENSTLFGYELGSRTSKFVSKIGTQNAEILPYCILVENGKAKALSAKYYIAISYPKLTMGDFMTIATVPGAIENDLKKAFK